MDAEPAPDPRRDAQMVLASWPAFERAIASLGPLPADDPVPLTALQVAPATRKQVIAALKVLALVDEHGVAHFRLRRASSRGDYSAVTDALADRYPAIARAIATGDREAMRAAVESLDAPASSMTRFWRFIRAAHQAAAHAALPALSFSAPPKRPSRSAGPPTPVAVDDPVARDSLEAELTSYQETLTRLLAIPDLAGSATVSDRLRELRNELRQHPRPGT